MILRHYLMIAKAGKETALAEALAALATQVRLLAGSVGVELYRDADDPRAYVFIERWERRDHHAAAGKTLGKAAFAPVMACLDGSPVGRFLV